MGSGFLCWFWFLGQAGFCCVSLSLEMDLKSAAELVGLCSISEQLMPPSGYELGSAATSFIRLLSQQAGGSNAHFAFGRPGLGSNLGVYSGSQEDGHRFHFCAGAWRSRSVEQIEVRCQDRQLPGDKEKK